MPMFVSFQAVPGQAYRYCSELFCPIDTMSASPVERTKIEGAEKVVP